MLSPLPEVATSTPAPAAQSIQTHQQPLEQALVGFVVANPVPLGMACLYVLLAFVQTLESSAPVIPTAHVLKRLLRLTVVM